jgi:regulator of CtrA degradation
MVHTMAEPADLSPTIVDALYNEALMLADEARAAFDLSGRLTTASVDEDLARIALSCEALRTTTRMMHAIAWLLNQRAYFAGELSEFQLRRHGRLPPPQPEASPDQLALLGPEIASLIERTRRFYARIERLDGAWRTRFAMHPAAIHRLRERLGSAVAQLR